MTVVAGLLVSVTELADRAAPAHALPPAGTGGEFVAATGRILDTRQAVSGQTAFPLTANEWRNVQVLGAAGVPTTDVLAVAVQVTAIPPSGSAQGTVALASATDQEGAVTALVYNAQVPGPTTGSSIVAVGSNGQISIKPQTQIDAVIDVQGYYTAGNGTPAPAGYVPVSPTRIGDTRTTTGALPNGRRASGTTTAVQVSGSAGVPTTASAVYVALTAVSYSASDSGYITVYPTGTGNPGTSLNYAANMPTVITANVALNSQGRLTIAIGGPTTPVDVVADVVGYFTANTNSAGFTTSQSRIYSTILPGNTPLAGGASTTVQLTGLNRVPLAGRGVTGIAIVVQVLHNVSGSTAGNVSVYPDDQAPTTPVVVAYPSGTSVRSDQWVAQPGADGGITLRNGGADPVNVIIDIQGWYAAQNSPATSGPNCELSGNRNGAPTPITRQLTDKQKFAFNAVNGNGVLIGSLFNIAGIGQTSTVTWRYNAINDTRPTLSVGGTESALQPYADGSILYTAPDGGCYFFPKNGADWKSPAGVNATLSQPSGANQWNLAFHDSRLTNVYTRVGTQILLSYTTDTQTPTPNKTSYTYNANNQLMTMTDTEGRTITFAYPNTTWSTQPATVTDTSLNRTVQLTYNGPNKALSRVQDAAGVITNLGYDTTGLVTLTNADASDPTLHQTAFGYDYLSRLTSFTFGAGTSTASLNKIHYNGVLNTQVLDPNHANVGEASSPAAAPFVTTYGIDITQHTVLSTTDPNGKTQSAIWSPNLDPQSRTDALSAVTKYTYDTVNNPNNLTNITAPGPNGPSGGRATNVTYGSQSDAAKNGAGGLAEYQPKDVTDSEGNQTSYSYFETTHQVKEVRLQNDPQSGHTNTGGGSVKYHYQGDENGTSCPNARTGQLCRMDAPNNDGTLNDHVTVYNYSPTGDLQTVTPPAPMGSTTFIHDAASRTTATTDGRGTTLYNVYDLDDRIRRVSTSATSCPAASCVRYTYNDQGWLTRRIDPSGTTNYTYDAQGRPLTKTNPNAAGQNTSATYDLDGNMTSYTDSYGTVTYNYDKANRLMTMSEPGGSCPAAAALPAFPNANKCTGFGYDDNRRRTSVNYPTGQTIVLEYDSNGRQKAVRSFAATSQQPNTLIASRAYSYIGVGNVDTDFRQDVTDQAGVKTTFKYDLAGRVTQAAVSNGTTTTWDYDAAGNRNRTKTVNGATTSYTSYGYGNDQQLCWRADIDQADHTCAAAPAGSTGYAIDGAGNQTGTTLNGIGNSSMSYNAFDQMTQSILNATTTTYAYADTTSDERTMVTTGSTSTGFVNGIGGLTQSSANGGTEYIRDPSGTPIAMITSLATTPVEYYYTLDALGSTIALNDTTAGTAVTYTYDTWGVTTNITTNGAGGQTAAAVNPYRYAGGYTDATGYIKFGTRYYDPTIGRFTQQDPARQGGNYYIYAGDNPVSLTDPSGRDWVDGLLDSISTAGDILSFVPVPIISGIGMAASTAADVGQVAYSCSGNGDEDCGSSVMDLGVGLVSGGVGFAAKYANEDAYGYASDGLDAVSGWASESGFYDDDDD